MFTLQIQCPTIEDAERILAALKHSANPAVVENLSSRANPAENPPTTSVGDFSRPDESERMGTARRALKAVQAKYGTNDMRTPLEVLARFGAGRISELQPDDYEAFIAACETA
jgi:hypothetical protein